MKGDLVLMKKWMLLLTALCLLLMGTGCAVVEEQEALAGVRPDLYWKNIWVIEERVNNIEVVGEYPDTIVKIEVYGRIRYEGEEPAQRVSVIIRSPLSFDFIADHRASNYGTVQPGEVLEYHLIQNYPEWREKVPIGVYKEHIIDDFKGNSYINISWVQDDVEHNEHFFEWKPKSY